MTLQCAAPLYRLLQKNAKWSGEPAEERVFLATKSSLTSFSVLTHYDSSKELFLDCDATPYGVGVILSHKVEDVSMKPIAYASRSLNPAEERYSQLEKEGLAIPVIHTAILAKEKAYFWSNLHPSIIFHSLVFEWFASICYPNTRSDELLQSKCPPLMFQDTCLPSTSKRHPSWSFKSTARNLNTRTCSMGRSSTNSSKLLSSMISGPTCTFISEC